jgi:magnesium-transporting ATPase (P-type)
MASEDSGTHVIRRPEDHRLDSVLSSIKILSRSFDISTILLFAKLTDNSLFPVALVGFLTNLLNHMLTPPAVNVAKTIDRLLILRWLFLLSMTVVSITYLIFFFFAVFDHEFEYKAGFLSIFEASAFYVLVVTASVVNILCRSVTHMIECDWIPVLSSCDDTSFTEFYKARFSTDL